MQVSINGKQRGELTPRLERALRVKRVVAVAEGVVLTPEVALGNAKRRMTLIYGVAAGVAALIVIAVIIGTASYEP